MISSYVVIQTTFMLFCLHGSMTESNNELQDIENVFFKCKKHSAEFDACMKQALNDLRPYFKRGIPEIGVAPFDPHMAKKLKQTGTIFGFNYTLILRDVYEYGWTQSTVTKFKTNWINATITYSQYFPEKFLEGQYEFKIMNHGEQIRRKGQSRKRKGRCELPLPTMAKRSHKLTKDVTAPTWVVEELQPDTASAVLPENCQIAQETSQPVPMASQLEKTTSQAADETPATSLTVDESAIEESSARARAGRWNLTLRDYSQTTRVTRSGSGVKVRVEIDRIGDMELHITNLLPRSTVLEHVVDHVINRFWKAGFGVVRPVINDLVSSAFTNIWSESFKNFNVHNLIKN